jgi:hypothetical protein
MPAAADGGSGAGTQSGVVWIRCKSAGGGFSSLVYRRTSLPFVVQDLEDQRSRHSGPHEVVDDGAARRVLRHRLILRLGASLEGRRAKARDRTRGEEDELGTRGDRVELP